MDEFRRLLTKKLWLLLETAKSGLQGGGRWCLNHVNFHDLWLHNLEG